MLLQVIVFVLYLVNVSYSLSYDDLAKDECFKKIYICGDYRVSITGGTGRLLTEPYRFGEVCRRHKEFIACIEEAAKFCAGNFSDLARMILDNRRSVKMFCTELEWKKNYFQSAACINRREQEVKDKCRLEEDERVDDRPWWCLIPEPCEAIQRVFNCTVRKMEKRCGSIAAEVFRRFHLLKVENQDVVCELRIRNPRYCRYATKAPSLKDEAPNLKDEIIKRIGSLEYPTSEAMDNLISSTIIHSVSLLKKLKLLSLKLQDSKELVLKNLVSHNYQLRKLLREFYAVREIITPSYSKDFADENSFIYENSNNMKTKIINSIYKLYELFNDNKDLILIGEDRVELSLKGLKEFPVEQMSCFWLKSSQNMFKCDIKVLSLKQANKMASKDFDLWEQLSSISTATDVEELLELLEIESSSTDEKEKFQSDNYFKEMDPLVFVSIDDSIFISSLNFSDIHRNGLLLDDPDKRRFEDIDDNEENDKMNSDPVLEKAKQKLKIESPPLKKCDKHPNFFRKLNKSSKYTFPITHNLEQFLEYQTEDLQLRKLEDILNKRFQNVDTVTDIKEPKSSDKAFSTKLNLDSNPNTCYENLYDAEHCKTNIDKNMKTFNSNVELKLNKGQILLELLNFVEE